MSLESISTIVLYSICFPHDFDTPSHTILNRIMGFPIGFTCFILFIFTAHCPLECVARRREDPRGQTWAAM